MMDHSLQVPVLFGPFRGRPRNRVPITRLLTETTIVQDFDAVDELTLENLARIALPTLLIYEEDSPFMETYAALRARLPNATPALLAVGDLKHFSPLEQPDLILEHTRAFLGPNGAGPTMTPAAERGDGRL
jgi:pimeloyl-ACP methyl ester carboxylesterase